MAASGNTTWSKGFSGNPDGEACGDLPTAELMRAIGDERVLYPPGSEEARLMTRQEALARTLWTRGVIDGDMTAIKLLVELLDRKGPAADAARALFSADDMAAAETLVRGMSDAYAV